MYKQFIITAAAFGLTAVILGAFGAHALKDKLTFAELENWKTGVAYQFYHTLAILFLASLAGTGKAYLNLSYYSFILGIVLFSGSLYLLSTRSITGITSARMLGPVTPVGGLFFIMGWLFLLLSAFKSR